MNFSVLTSVYYKEAPEFLNAALESIWDAQTIHPTEIVLVKDGPLTSALDAVIAEWQLKLGDTLKVIALEQNVGLGKALNEGLIHCSYEWIFRMDTDDIAAPNRFEKQIRHLKYNPHIDVLGGSLVEFEGNVENATLLKKAPCGDVSEIKKYAQQRCPLNHPTVAMKKSVILAVSGYPSTSMEDYCLWLKVIEQGYHITNIPDILLYMRTDTMHSRRRGVKYIKSEWDLFKLKRELRLQSFFPALINFICRVNLRLIPTIFLKKIYSYTRVKAPSRDIT